ncbi:hypothetical protein MtrunA17_Chr3g0083141 [Medicago truncatula]|uniref:Uncharacterized protein n=1 Tax=Medicago truncatula TaxID=3880 RepID=A0A396IM70_MEDTR|nr:hypothetical protein MtrunA17_Chr3g0083141 [Medicago truncatula]
MYVQVCKTIKLNYDLNAQFWLIHHALNIKEIILVLKKHIGNF